jgi:hypothetical protein
VSARRAGVGAALAVLALLGSTSGAAFARGDGASQHHVRTSVLAVPPGTDPSEPHLAVDPGDPMRLFAVAQVGIAMIGGSKELLWRTGDGGRSWARSPLLGGAGTATGDESGDPVVAAGGGGHVVYGTLVRHVDPIAATATIHVGTRVSTDDGATFTAFGDADSGTVPLCVFEGCPPPPDASLVDKPWLAVDATVGAFGGSAYLVWLHLYADGRRDLLLSVSRDQGRTYARPVLLDRSSEAEMAGMEELAQVVVEPDGTVDAVWNGLRSGRPVILHAASGDGGRSFTDPEPVVRLRPEASRLGVVTSLAVSRRRRLGLCWSQARSPDRYDARISCTVSGPRARRWRDPQQLPPGDGVRQYLPAAAFQGDRLWVAAYASDATSTQLVAAQARRRGFTRPFTVSSWPIPAGRICAPHPPDCQEGQTFIGDYIGLVAAGRRMVAGYIAPSAGASQTNQVLVSSFR